MRSQAVLRRACGAPYLLGLGGLREDEGEEAQADFLVLGGAFAHLRHEEGKICAVTHRGIARERFLPEDMGLLSNLRRGTIGSSIDGFLLLKVMGQEGPILLPPSLDAGQGQEIESVDNGGKLPLPLAQQPLAGLSREGAAESQAGSK